MVESEDHETTLMRVLYDEHAAALWRYAVRLTGDRARAEDVVQETLLRAWQHPEVTEDTGDGRKQEQEKARSGDT